MKKNTFAAITCFICILIYGCNNKKVIGKGYTADGLRYEMVKVNNDSLTDSVEKIFYKNSDSVYEEIEFKDNEKVVEDFFSTKAFISFATIWEHNRKIECKYFDTDAHTLTAIQYYTNVHDTDFPNEYFKFSPRRDTIKSESFYCSVYDNGNIVKNGDEFSLEIVLDAPKYNCAYVRFFDFDDKFYVRPGSKLDSMEMYNFKVLVITRKYHLGTNKIRGEIVNYEDYTDSATGEIKRREKHLFYRGKFFVKQ